MLRRTLTLPGELLSRNDKGGACESRSSDVLDYSSFSSSSQLVFVELFPTGHLILEYFLSM